MPSSNCGVSAPRLYQLDPLLAGTIDRWPSHLERIRALGFDGVVVGACFAAGETASLDAPADPFALDRRVLGEARDAGAALADFVEAAAAKGLEVVLEAVVPVIAEDAGLVRDRPGWIARDHEGRPRPSGAGVELALGTEDAAQGEYVEALLRHYLTTGVKGLWLAHAHRVPAALWAGVLGRLEPVFPGRWFIADLLGTPADRWQAYERVGFTGVLDSSRWWNFHDHWFLEQQPRLSRIGTPFAFPEEPRGERLAASVPAGDDAAARRRLEARYMAALGLGTGLVVPMGYEYGATRPLDARTGSPDDWAALVAAPAVDLTSFIGAANRLKTAHPALSEVDELRRVNAPNARAVALARLSHPSPETAEGVVFVCANPEGDQADGIDPLGLVTAAGGRFDQLVDITPDSGEAIIDPCRPIALEPGEVRLIASKAAARKVSRAGRNGAAAARRIQKMAAARVAIERVRPELDGGRFPIKRLVGDVLTVEADVFMDGHDKLRAELLVRPADARAWSAVPMALIENDRWRGSVPLTRNVRHVYTVEAWHDVFGSWCAEVTKKHAAGVPIGLELEEGRRIVARTAEAAEAPQREALDALIAALAARPDDEGFQLERLLSSEVEALMAAADLKANLTRYDQELEVVVDRTIAGFASWYELFPRSMSDDPARHGTFDDVIRKLPYVRDMGFDVLYFPPIHPIGRTNRKGRNNSVTSEQGDTGSPYAIGAAEGGHMALHPELGTFEDFARLVTAAHDHGLEIAIDIAINCSPDHPWLREHPEWFDWRPDGSLKYAENPPKKYEDITNVDFYNEGAVPGLWLALRDMFAFWIEHGVKIFRVDNPHTKPLPFWEWMIADIQSRHPEAIFLSEAFTRPKMMKRLAKLGFTQSYSYFTWRNHKAELQEYLVELTQDEPKEHMRPNFFVNTPDINPVYLQTSGRAGFQTRAVLASTLSTLWGVYSGFELCEGTPLPGREEYLDSEKYEIKAWDWDRPTHIRDDIRLLNAVRRANPALWSFANLEFHNAWNDDVMVYSKMTPSLDNAVLIAVSLDPHNAQSADFEVPLWRFGLDDAASIGVEDLITGRRFTWTGKVQHIRLDPRVRPYQLWRLVSPGLAAASPFADRR